MLLDGPVLAAIAKGAAVLGAGGGGDTGIGLLIARQAIEESAPPELVSLEGLPGDQLLMPCGGMGAPAVSFEKIENGDEGARLPDRIAVMYLGRVVEEGPAKEVVHNPQHPYTKALMSAVPRPDPRERKRREILQGETPNPIDVPPDGRCHPRCPVAQDVCKVEDPALHPAAAGSTPEHRSACLFT